MKTLRLIACVLTMSAMMQTGSPTRAEVRASVARRTAKLGKRVTRRTAAKRARVTATVSGRDLTRLVPRGGVQLSVMAMVDHTIGPIPGTMNLPVRLVSLGKRHGRVDYQVHRPKVPMPLSPPTSSNGYYASLVVERTQGHFTEASAPSVIRVGRRVSVEFQGAAKNFKLKRLTFKVEVDPRTLSDAQKTAAEQEARAVVRSIADCLADVIHDPHTNFSYDAPTASYATGATLRFGFKCTVR